MQIVTKVRGTEDFSRELISGNLFKYGHSHPRVYSGDIIIYYMPQENAMGVYQVKEETEAFVKPDFTFYSGTMVRFNGTPQQFIDHVRCNNSDEMADTFVNIIQKLISS